MDSFDLHVRSDDGRLTATLQVDGRVIELQEVDSLAPIVDLDAARRAGTGGLGCIVGLDAVRRAADRAIRQSERVDL